MLADLDDVDIRDDGSFWVRSRFSSLSNGQWLLGIVVDESFLLSRHRWRRLCARHHHVEWSREDRRLPFICMRRHDVFILGKRTIVSNHTSHPRMDDRMSGKLFLLPIDKESEAGSRLNVKVQMGAEFFHRLFYEHPRFVHALQSKVIRHLNCVNVVFDLQRFVMFVEIDSSILKSPVGVFASSSGVGRWRRRRWLTLWIPLTVQTWHPLQRRVGSIGRCWD